MGNEERQDLLDLKEIIETEKNNELERLRDQLKQTQQIAEEFGSSSARPLGGLTSLLGWQTQEEKWSAAEMTVELKQQSSEIDRLHKMVEDRQTDIQTLKHQLVVGEAKLKQSDSEIKYLRKSKEEESLKVQNDLSEATWENARLLKDNVALQQKLIQEKVKGDSFEGDLSQKKGECDYYCALCTSLRHELETAKEENALLGSKLVKLKDKCEDYELTVWKFEAVQILPFMKAPVTIWIQKTDSGISVDVSRWGFRQIVDFS
eukprot:Platyproteum_vivax@DN2204_c0_g1_i1.p1